MVSSMISLGIDVLFRAKENRQFARGAGGAVAAVNCVFTHIVAEEARAEFRERPF